MRILSRAAGRLALATAAATAAAAVAAGALTTAPAQAVNGDAVPSGSQTFVARVQVGSQRSCSGALVAANWVLTAKSCFPAPGVRAKSNGLKAPRVKLSAAGPQKLPSDKTVVTVGAVDLTQTGGVRAQVTDMVEHPDRDLVLLEFDAWIYNIPPIAIGAAPTAGEKLSATGYGRTTDTWVPDTAHTTAVTAGTPTADTFAVTGDGDRAPVCKGDAGGPTFRERDGKPELVAVHRTTGLRGCVGAPETATAGATETRVDDLASWIASSTDRTSLPASADRWIKPTGYMCTNKNGGRLRWDGRYLSVLDRGGHTRGAPITDNPGSEYLHFHHDGNLVVWKGDQAQWASNTSGHPGARLVCDDDWGVSIVDSDGKFLWQSGTGPVIHAQTELEYRSKAQPTPLCTSIDNQMRLMWSGGYLGVYDINGKPRGRTLNWYSAGDRVHFHGDGNLVVWNGNQQTWYSQTNGHSNAQLFCQNDGDVLIRDGNTMLWRSGTSAQIAAKANFHLGNTLGYACVSPDTRTKMYWYTGEFMASDGWRSGSEGAAEGWETWFQSDGNLVMRDKTGAIKWASKTAGHPNAFLRCQDDGNIAIVDGTAKLWDTNSRPTGVIRANLTAQRCITTDPEVSTTWIVSTGDCGQVGPPDPWTIEPDGPIHGVFENGCLDIQGASTADKAKIILYKCTGAANQVWKRGANGSLLNPISGKCLDIPGSSTVEWTKLQLYTCNGSAAQRWTLPVPKKPGEIDPVALKFLKQNQALRTRR
ncbi:ricin-type beta-trefoil lectin domain protein [Actinomadura opuntiae]|uniref:ricin-type beta-trefoil lectin domain protein n=1 Tax=Actinomadura sp. OS1-43 TaxID=604315 RepID=UPI00255ADF1A|nr:ricin-type beta-trefoil lectin domain protein [Actinomadura sp. OS1-43]MDL4815028.1 ricin-type beta-trefoil lectin domain protein [Actinomadura sp. OS1-43]